jgi:thioesterase domain-containing protein/acyl carrier protein
MVPSAFMLLSEFPLTANGKIDRRALPAFTHEVVQQSREFVAPTDRTERILAEIWADLLKVENVGIHDDFFDFGGHSLLAIKAVARIRDAFEVDLPLATLLHAPTIAQLAKMLRKERCAPTWNSLVPLRTSGSKPPLFLMHAHGGNVLEYHTLARLIDADQPVYALQARGLDGNIPSELTLERMASEYIAEMRTLQSEGPYFLAGFCFGGLVAFEIAQQLRQAGEEVGLLILIQSTHPAVFHQFKPGISAPRRWWYRLEKQFDLERENRSHAGKGYLLQRFRQAGDLILARFALKVSSSLGKHPLKSPYMPKLFIYEKLKKEHLKTVPIYRPRQYDGHAVLIRASKQIRGLIADESLGWRNTFVGHCEICQVPGHQQNLMLEPNVRRLAREMNDHLRIAHRRCGLSEE